MLMPNVIAAAAPGTVQITTTFLQDTAVFPTVVRVGIKFTASGDEQTFEGNGQPYATVAPWLLSGAAGSYEINYNPTGDTPSGDPTNTWLNMGTDRSWELGGGVSNCSGPIQIRRASDSVVVVNQNLEMNVESSP